MFFLQLSPLGVAAHMLQFSVLVFDFLRLVNPVRKKWRKTGATAFAEENPSLFDYLR